MNHFHAPAFLVGRRRKHGERSARAVASDHAIVLRADVASQSGSHILPYPHALHKPVRYPVHLIPEHSQVVHRMFLTRLFVLPYIPTGDPSYADRRDELQTPSQ
jgi:hypothetical protein